MDGPSLQGELDVAREAARAGGEIALQLCGTASARRKLDGTWVTEADEAVESALRLRIGRAFPEHNVLGEEQGLRAADGGPPRSGAPTWVIDPIDGTSNYVGGIPVWAVLIGLRVAGSSVVGVAHAPALRETYEAALGFGASLNGRSIAVDPVGRLEDAKVLFGAASPFAEAQLEPFREVLSDRAARHDDRIDFWGHLLVASGAAHAMVEAASLSVWDVAALEPIIAEAGGVMSQPSGEPWREGTACMTTCGPQLHASLTDLYQRHDP